MSALRGMTPRRRSVQIRRRSIQIRRRSIQSRRQQAQAPRTPTRSHSTLSPATAIRTRSPSPQAQWMLLQMQMHTRSRRSRLCRAHSRKCAHQASHTPAFRRCPSSPLPSPPFRLVAHRQFISMRLPGLRCGSVPQSCLPEQVTLPGSCCNAGAAMQVCERIGPCADCQYECGLNRELTEIPGEITGATLSEQFTNVAAIFCPALTLLVRYGVNAPDQANMVRFLLADGALARSSLRRAALRPLLPCCLVSCSLQSDSFLYACWATGEASMPREQGAPAGPRACDHRQFHLRRHVPTRKSWQHSVRGHGRAASCRSSTAIPTSLSA